MGHAFEFGEHGLAEDRPADGVDLAIDQIGSLLVAVGLSHHMAREKLFVECTGHLGDEDGVVVVGERLGSRREEAVHGVARLVRQGEHVIEHVGLIVHQDIRN